MDPEVQARTKRRRIGDELASKLDRIGHTDEARKVSGCGRQFVRVTCGGCGQTRLMSYHCSSRVCPECSHRKSVVMASRWSKGLKHFMDRTGATASFLTLTWKDTPELRPVNYYTKCRKKFFRDPVWKKYGLRGGIVAMEVKVGSGSGLWHTHLHCVVLTDKSIPLITFGRNKGRFQVSANEELAAVWQSVTGDSRIVYGSAVDLPDGLREVLKYITKVNSLDEQKLSELLRWSWHRRFVTSFGELYGDKELQSVMDEPDELPSLGDRPCSCGSCQFTVDHFLWRPDLGEFVVMRSEVVTVDPGLEPSG